MVVIFSGVFIGWNKQRLFPSSRPLELVAFHAGKQNYRLETIGGREARQVIDFSAAISDPLSFTYPFSLLISAFPPLAHLLPHGTLVVVRRRRKGGQDVPPLSLCWSMHPSCCSVNVELLLSGRRTHSHSKVKYNAMTEGDYYVWANTPSRLGTGNIQFAAIEDVTQGARLHQGTLVLLCCSHNHDALHFA